MENKKPEVRLTGAWRLIRKSNVSHCDERTTILFKEGQDYIVGFPSGGIMTEQYGGVVTTTPCVYDPAGRTISVRATDLTPASPISGGGDRIYRVVPLNDGRMYLRRPHTVEDDDPDTEFELILLERI